MEKIVRELKSQIEGEFLGFLPSSGGKLKYIQVKVGTRILPIKLAKELRKNLIGKLQEGDRLGILLKQVGSRYGTKLELKTDHVVILNQKEQSLELGTPNMSSKSKKGKKKKGTILLCGKSSCSKRGGKQLTRALTTTLKKLGLQERIDIEVSSCQKQCKKAPSFILMPGKVKQNYINPNQLTSLIKDHYL